MTGEVVPGGLQVVWVPPFPEGHSAQPIVLAAGGARVVFEAGTVVVLVLTCSTQERDGMMGTPTPTGEKGADKAEMTSLVNP